MTKVEEMGPLVILQAQVSEAPRGQRERGDAPELAAIQHPVARIILLCRRAHRHDIAAGARLRHGQRAHLRAREQLGQILGLLRLGAVPCDLVDAEIGVRAVREADGGRGARDLWDESTSKGGKASVRHLSLLAMISRSAMLRLQRS